jgi:hypothetical protein
MRIPFFRRRNTLRRRVGLAPAAIAFSLTFAVAGISILLGWIPADEVPGGTGTTVLLLLVPLATLLLGIVAEVVRHEVGGHTALAVPPVPAWEPGVREG